MIALWGIMALSVLLSLWLRAKGALYETDWYLRFCTIIAPIGFLTVLAGWATTEVGRQPWTVYGQLRTADSVTPSITGFDVLLSFLGYSAVYLLMFAAGIALIVRIVRKGPAEAEEDDEIEAGRPKRPATAIPHAEGGQA
jgi:cytochrome d ubiquinol oxidase subunit I